MATSKPIKNFTFKDKNCPKYPGNPTVITNDDELFLLTASLRMSIKDYFTPPRCRLCYDKLNVYADLVCGDPHGIQDVDMESGEGLVFSRSEKGNKLLSDMLSDEKISLRIVETHAILMGQGIDKKKIEWNLYMNAWEEMGGYVPDYSDNVKGNLISVDENLQLYIKNLNHGLRLCREHNRERIISGAKFWLMGRKIRRLFSSPVTAITKKFGKNQKE